MKNPIGRILIILAVLVSALLACSLLGGGSPANEAPSEPEVQITEAAPVMETQEMAAPEEPMQTEAPAEAEVPASYDTDFPLPDDVRNFMITANGSINFQTGMTMQAVIEYYRGEFTAQGLTERPILTKIGDTSFSMVFDGDPAGAVVIQGVDLGDGTTNVNIRHEDV
ncbi:MAG: hypothetical protein JW908_06210 [Anaerolineales bacterium]|nr:hypothetical protein [Anaerolineales bacterium]